MKKILITEDHDIVISGLRMIFEKSFRQLEIVVVKSLGEMMKALLTSSYDMTIVDLQLTDGMAINLIPQVIALYPNMQVLVFTGLSEEMYADRLYKYGVKGFLNKNTEEPEIVLAVETILNGNIYFSQYYKEILLAKKENPLANGNPFSHLSQREMETALLLLQGKRGNEICQELNLHPSTVTGYKLNVFTKLRVKNVVDLERIARLYNII